MNSPQHHHPSRADSIKFIFDNFYKEFKDKYTQYAFCGLSSTEPFTAYPMLQGNIIELREAVEAAVMNLRQSYALKNMYGPDTEISEALDPNNELVVETLTFLESTPEILDHYIFVGVLKQEGEDKTVLLHSKKGELYTLYCGRRLVEAVSEVALQNVLGKSPAVTMMSQEAFDRILMQLLRSLALFEKSRQPLTSIAVIVLLIDALVYHNYPLLEESDRLQIKRACYDYLKYASVITEADIKVLEKAAYKACSIEELQQSALDFIKSKKFTDES